MMGQAEPELIEELTDPGNFQAMRMVMRMAVGAVGGNFYGMVSRRRRGGAASGGSRPSSQDIRTTVRTTGSECPARRTSAETYPHGGASPQ